MNQRVDISASGVSFIDILFALVVGVILGPVQAWARDPAKNHLAAGTTSHLVVALVLVLTSWIGYHNSANKPQFRIRFFNIELGKFSLDILMVVVYFLVASVASRRPLSSREEMTLIAIAFVLYLLWDLAGYLQKQPGSDYEKAWDVEKALTPEIGPWNPRQGMRVVVTLIFFVASAILAAASFVTPVGSYTATIILDVLAVASLVAYRFTKDHVRSS